MLEPLENAETRSPSPKSESFETKSASAASASINSSGERKSSTESRGRRSKPSVVYSAPRLPSVSEKSQDKESRGLSGDSTLTVGTVREKPSNTVKTASEENVVSSIDVRQPGFRLRITMADWTRF